MEPIKRITFYYNSLLALFKLSKDYAFLSDAKPVLRLWNLRMMAIKLAKGRKGLFLEFGVSWGTTINFFAGEISPFVIYGFDSFEGIPDAWNAYEKGSFTLNGKTPKVKSNVKLVKGWYDKTVRRFVASHNGEKVAFVHIDCDVYSSTRTIFKEIRGLDLDGTYMLFDEFYKYQGWREGEYKAFNEFLKESGYKAEYLAFAVEGEQVLARLHR